MPDYTPVVATSLPAERALRAARSRAARAAGIDAVGISEIELSEDERHLQSWLERGWHGSMQYMARHGSKPAGRQEPLPGTLA